MAKETKSDKKDTPSEEKPKTSAKKIPVRKTTSKTAIKKTTAEEKNERKENTSGTEPTQPTYKRLYRSKTNAVLAGVAGGLAEYFAIDPVIIRLLFVLSTFFGGFGIPVYIILWIILPEKDSGDAGTEETIQHNINQMRDKTREFTQNFSSSGGPDRSRNLFAIVLILIGIVFLLNNFDFIRFDIFWPLVLVVIGLAIMMRR